MDGWELGYGISVICEMLGSLYLPVAIKRRLDEESTLLGVHVGAWSDNSGEIHPEYSGAIQCGGAPGGAGIRGERGEEEEAEEAVTNVGFLMCFLLRTAINSLPWKHRLYTVCVCVYRG